MVVLQIASRGRRFEGEGSEVLSQTPGKVRPFSKLERLQIFSERLTEIIALQSQFHGGLEKTQLVSGIVAFAFEHVTVNRLFSQQPAQPIRQLNLAARSTSGGR